MNTRLKKVWLKLLKASCKKNWDKARKQNAKIIQLELEMKNSGKTGKS